MYASSKNTFSKKILFYFSFMISSAIGALLCQKHDLIIATSPTLPVAIAGYFVSKIRNTRIILDIRDIWPDSAVVVGVLADKTILYCDLKKFERFLYTKANIITVPVQGLSERIGKRTKTPIFHLPNTVNLDNFKTTRFSNVLRRKYGVGGKFIVLYSGNHGLAQGLEFILQSAVALKRFEDILFLFVGEGVRKISLEEQKRKLKLDNVLFLGKKDRKEMPDIINISSICLVPLKKSNLFLNALPSKMFEYMALKKPIILSVRGEAKKLLEDAKAGISIEPENSKDLSEAVLKLYKNHKLVRLFGENGYKYINRFYSHQRQLESCEKLLRGL